MLMLFFSQRIDSQKLQLAELLVELQGNYLVIAKISAGNKGNDLGWVLSNGKESSRCYAPNVANVQNFS